MNRPPSLEPRSHPGYAGMLCALLITLIAPTASMAQVQGEGVGTFEQARERLKYEPGVAETMRAALRYFRVDPKNFDRLRRTAKTRALLPTLAAGYRLDDTTYSRNENKTISLPHLIEEGQSTQVNTISVGAVWDLRELVFNPAEVQVYGLIGVQRDLMLETTRIYYLRKQLFVRFLNSPPQDPLAREALLLRVDEFTALLDVLTGGWFSRSTERRMQATHRAGQGSAAATPPPRRAQPTIRAWPVTAR